jgi:hypothetical protein
MIYFQPIKLFYPDRYLQVCKGNVSVLSLDLQGFELEVGILLHCCQELVKTFEKMVLRYPTVTDMVQRFSQFDDPDPGPEMAY